MGHVQERCSRQEARRRCAEAHESERDSQGGLREDLERHEARRRRQDQPRKEVHDRRGRQLTPVRIVRKVAWTHSHGG